MYGYVRPHKPDLRIKDFQLYRAVYCGLCHALKKNYGHMARFAVSYDMCLPALIFLINSATSCHKRCVASPFKKKCVICEDAALEACAAFTIILAFYKLKDEIADGRFFKRLFSRFLLLLLKPKYKKAAALMPEFDKVARTNLSELSTVENSASHGEGDSAVLDRCAAYFANIVAAFSTLAESENERRATRELFFHVGRVVYILDAADDYENDLKSSCFNAVAIRYDINAQTLPENIKAELSETIEHSLCAATAAFELLDEGPTTPIVSNILYLGMIYVLQEVLSVDKKKRKKRL